MDLLPTQERLHRVFGPNAFAAALFYANEPALRFELSRHGAPVDLFTQAFDRAREILGYVFGESTSPVVVLAFYDTGPPVRNLAVFRSLRRCGVRLRRPWACWTEGDGGADPEERTLVAFRAEAADVDRILWGALAADLGIRPALACRAYFADPERGVLVHPYDDRGMDVIGPDHALLSALFHRFHGYLLDYDMARMRSFFAPSA